MTFPSAGIASDNRSYTQVTKPEAIAAVLANIEGQVEKPTPRIKLNPAIGLSTLPSFDHVRPGLGGAWRAWIFARKIDHQGSGKVTRKALRAYFAELGANTRTFDNWIDQAVIYGLFKPDPGNTTYYLASEARTARKCGCEKLSKRSVWIPADKLLSVTWRAYVYASWRSQFKAPISQETIQELTGIHPRTQSRYLKDSKADRVRNVARYNTRINKPGAIEIKEIEEDLGNRAYYRDNRGNLSRRLPDTVNLPDKVELHQHRGRTKKAQQELRKLLSDDFSARDSTKGRANKKSIRLFWNVKKVLENVMRLRRNKTNRLSPLEYFLRGTQYDSTTNWSVVPND